MGAAEIRRRLANTFGRQHEVAGDDVTVIPVLVEDARMPSRAELPPPLPNCWPQEQSP